MTTTENLVSVIVPAYNAASFLPKAIASIDRQGYHPLEIIVIDDGSKDNSQEVLRSYGTRIRNIRQSSAATILLNAIRGVPIRLRPRTNSSRPSG